MKREMSENLKSITIGRVLEYRKQRRKAKTMGEFKALDRENRDRHDKLNYGKQSARLDKKT